MGRNTRNRRGRMEWTLSTGWLLVLGTAGWLIFEVVSTTYRSRDKYVATAPDGADAATRGATQDAARGGGAARGLDAIAQRGNGKTVLVLMAVDRARMKATQGEVVDVRDVLSEYEGLRETGPESVKRLKTMLDRTGRDGLTIRNARRGYSLTSDGRKLLQP